MLIITTLLDTQGNPAVSALYSSFLPTSHRHLQASHPLVSFCFLDFCSPFLV